MLAILGELMNDIRNVTTLYKRLLPDEASIFHLNS